MNSYERMVVADKIGEQMSSADQSSLFPNSDGVFFCFFFKGPPH